MSYRGSCRVLLTFPLLCTLMLGQQCSTSPQSNIAIPPPSVPPQPQVTLHTSMGDIVVELFPQQAPLSVANFLQYAQEGAYNNTIFDFVDAGNSIVAGNFTADLQPIQFHDPIANESNNGLQNLRGRLAVVEPNGTDSGTSLFMIILQDDSSADFNLASGDRGRTVFGKVVSGMDVADAIGNLPLTTRTAADGSTLDNTPSDPVIITTVDAGATTPPPPPPPPTGENHPPVANAGPDRNVAPGINASLNGSASNDPDGDKLTFLWEQTAGDPVTLTNATNKKAIFVVPATQSVFTFKVTVDDGRGGTDSASVTLTVVLEPKVRLKTTLGDVVLDILLQDAPITSKNFLQYVDEQYYNGTIFHRVVPDFVVQGGGFLPGLVKQSGERAPIVNEFSADRSNIRGTVAMAKLGGDPDSATSQFFFNLSDNSGNLDHQNGGFTVFANVDSGMDVVDAMGIVPTTTKQGFSNVPVTDIVITSATVE